MDLAPSTVGWLAIAALTAALAAGAAAVVALRAQARTRSAYEAFSMGGRDDVLTLLQRHVEEVRRLRADVGGLRDYTDQLRGLIADGISRVATVRYDAFEEMGGHLSFSTALLDEHGDGLVLTCISGRTDTRAYAKPVVGGASRHNLSTEEAQAIREALSGGGRTGETLAARRRSVPRAS